MIVITYGGEPRTTPLTGSVLTLVPALDAEQSLGWACGYGQPPRRVRSRVRRALRLHDHRATLHSFVVPRAPRHEKPIVPAASLGFALTGLRTAWRTENSFKTHVVAAVAVVGVLLWFEPAPLWWAIAAVTVAFVVAAEVFNTAVEGLADHLHPEQHPAIKAVKDCAAGAVLVASTAALAVAAAFVYDVVLR